MLRQWNSDFAATLAAKQPAWTDRLEDEVARHGPLVDATGLALARVWVATI